MTDRDVPDDLLAIAEARAAARRARDWATADQLKAEIEATGWRVIDTGTLYDLERSVAPDVADGDTLRYGASRSVPSRLEDAERGVATVVVVAEHETDDVAGALRMVLGGASAGTTAVVVANGLPERAGLPEGVETVRTASRFGAAAARNAGIRRASAPVVILLDPATVPTAGLVDGLVAALGDPTVAVAGASGLVTGDLAHYEAAPAGTVDVVAVALDAMAFRRSDAVSRGLLDEGFVAADSLGEWWSLVLRDPDDEAPEGTPPRRAVQVPGVLEARGTPDPGPAPEGGDARLAKRNRYRLLKRFATRRDLLVPPR